MAGNKKIEGAPKDPVLISVVSESLPHLKRGAMRDFLLILEAQKCFKEDSWNKTDFIYTFGTGSKIEFFGVEQADKVKGPRRDVLWLNEAPAIAYETFEQLAIRTNNYIFLDWNPSYEFWFYTELLTHRKDIDHITLTYKDNEALAPNIVLELEQKKYRKNWWQVYGLGQLGEIEGRVYTNWSVIDDIPHEARLERYGLDFGFSNDPTAIVAIYYYNGGYILDEEVCQTGMTNREIANFLKNKPKALIVADSAEPKSIAEIKEYGLNVVPCVKKGNKGTDYKEYSISTVQDQKISVTRTSVSLLKEYRAYLWARDKNDKIIQGVTDGNDDCLDSIRYGLTSLTAVIRRKEILGTMSRQFPQRQRHNIAV